MLKSVCTCCYTWKGGPLASRKGEGALGDERLLEGGMGELSSGMLWGLATRSLQLLQPCP